MNPLSAISEQPKGLLNGIFDRLETLLRPASAGTFSANEAMLTAVIRAAGRPFGVKPAAGVAPGADEPLGDAVQRISRSAGLIAREIVLGHDWQQSLALPVIAIRKSNGVPVALLPRGTGWRHVDGSAPKHSARITRAIVTDLQPRAWVLGPALPDTALSGRALLGYGLSVKRSDLAAYSLMSALAGLALAFVPMANMVVTDLVLPGRDVILLQHVVAMLLALMLASLVTRFSAALCQLRMDGKTGSMLRAAAADRMIRLARASDAKAQSPATAALITRSAEGWHRGVWKLGLTVLSGVLVAAPSLAVMARTAPLAALLVIGIMVAAVATAAVVAKRQIDYLFSGPSSPTSWIASSFEALQQIVTVRAMAAEQRFFKQFSESFLGLKDKFLVSDRMGAIIHAIEHSLEAMVVSVAIGTVVIINPELTANDSIAFTMAVMTVAGAAVSIISGFSQACMLGMQRRMIEPFMNGVPAAATVGSAPAQLTGQITAHDIVVRPSRYAPPVLDGISFVIEPGQQIGIVGPSGSGKSTLLAALLGLCRADRGRVLFDGADLAQLDAAAVRRQIGVVSQSGRLFPGTILDNIAAGVPLSHDDAWRALATASLDHDIRSMPLGLSTPIGDADPVLSSGQVQRLLIARAVAQRPKILILDEATSTLDPLTEERVANALSSLGATVISVAHRLDTLRHCHTIHVLDRGRVVQSGSFTDLLGQAGLFASMKAVEDRAGKIVGAAAGAGVSTKELQRAQVVQRIAGATIARHPPAQLPQSVDRMRGPSAAKLDDAMARLGRLKAAYGTTDGNQ